MVSGRIICAGRPIGEPDDRVGYVSRRQHAQRLRMFRRVCIAKRAHHGSASHEHGADAPLPILPSVAIQLSNSQRSAGPVVCSRRGRRLSSLLFPPPPRGVERRDGAPVSFSITGPRPRGLAGRLAISTPASLRGTPAPHGAPQPVILRTGPRFRDAFWYVASASSWQGDLYPPGGAPERRRKRVTSSPHRDRIPFHPHSVS
jgi:hypothetical protein